jgi:hypothetical protein
MGTHIIPRSNVKGQDRLFIFFSVQGLVGTLIGCVIGVPFYSIVRSVFNSLVGGLIVLAVFGAIGFVIGQVKVPDNNGNPLFKKLGGLYVREAILAYFKFKSNKKKYVIPVSDTEVFEEHKETWLEKKLLNKKEEKHAVTEEKQ